MGVGRVFTRLGRDLPLMARDLQNWMTQLAGSPEPADYFLHPVAFPLMLLPWWVERQLKGEVDPDFQSDLIFSNATMYYYIRLVDNVMDGHATVEQKMLPIAGYFVNQFHSVYHRYFNDAHPFWDYLQHTWAEFCDVTAADGKLTHIDEPTFASTVGRKVCAAKISVAAVCYRYDSPELVQRWDEWIDTFGCWHLFREDMFDWQQDLSLGAATYFLCEARRRKTANELEVGWIAREGLDWGYDQLKGWMNRLHLMTFASSEVRDYLEFREQELITRREKLRPALEFILQVSSGKKS